MVTGPISNLVIELGQRFPEVTLAGTRGVCRHIKDDPNRPWSQHSWENALDIGVPNAPTGWTVYTWLITNRSRLSLSTICFKGLGGCDAADHQTHIHVSGAPKLKGTPPCAGGDAAPEPKPEKPRTFLDQLLYGIRSTGPVQGIEQGYALATGHAYEGPEGQFMGSDKPAPILGARLVWGGAGAVLVIFGLAGIFKVLGVTIPTPITKAVSVVKKVAL